MTFTSGTFAVSPLVRKGTSEETNAAFKVTKDWEAFRQWSLAKEIVGGFEIVIRDGRRVALATRKIKVSLTV